MADTFKTTNELKIETMFVDGDTRTFSLKNPRADIAQSDIASLNAFMQDTNIIVGDKYGGRFGKILKASTVEKTTVKLDLTDPN